MRRSLHLLYHELTEQPTPYGYALTTQRFQTHLEVFKHAQGSANLFSPILTFDDGHLSNFTLARPLLEQAGLRAHFFITAGWTSRRPEYMNGVQLKALHEGGHHIGAHGWSHKLLTQCSREELRLELVQTRSFLEDLLGAKVSTLSLPGGRYNKQVLDFCRAAGYSQVFTSTPQATDPTDALIGRINLRSDATAEILSALLSPSSNLLSRFERSYRMKQAGQRLLGDTAYHRLWSLLNRAPAQADEGSHA